MARFRYSMQSILDIKMKLENQARQEFANARAALDEEEEKLAELRRRKASYEKEAEDILTGSLDLRKVEENRMAILCMDEYIENQKVRVAAAEKTLEQKREILTEAMTERKTHETLKEKAFELFLEEEKRAESKEVDELTSYTYSAEHLEQAAR